MNISTSTNNYQSINAYQQPKNHIQPITPEQPISPTKPTTEYSPEDVYKASNGNVIANKDGELSLTPEGKLNISNRQDANANEEAAVNQAKRDNNRENAVDYVAYQSKKSQVEIYLSVSADSKVDLDDGTATIIESLRETQKQNNSVQAYAQYQENQKGGEAILF